MNIKLNDFKYRYDVYQMFNIYFPLEELKFSESEGDYSIAIENNKGTFEYKDIKDEALENETIESLKNGDIYIQCIENRAPYEIFTYIPTEILENYIQKYLFG